MNILTEFDKVFLEYKKITFSLSEEEKLNELYNYVYYSNSLEGNKLNLAQTTTLLRNNIASGNLPLRDYLEAKGHFKALKTIINFADNKYPFDERVLKTANKLTLEAFWNIEDSYFNWKKAGQLPGEYKVLENKIIWEFENKKGEIMPHSNPENVKRNMDIIIKSFNESKSHISERVAYLAFNIFINQPFNDANKRTARLITTFATLKEGLPLTSFDKNKNTNFNHTLILSHIKKEKEIFIKFLAKDFLISMKQKIEKEKDLRKQTKNGLSFLI